jgi:membrane-associated phospholipid phosphatase
MFAGGAALLTWSGVLCTRADPDPSEIALFRWINGRSDSLRRPNWVLMLGGTFGAIPVSAGAALLMRRPRLAGGLAIGGSAAYLLAKAVKPLVGRARPGGLLEGVTFRDQIGGDHGWVSGHTAVATSVALIAGPSLPSPARAGIYAWAATVGAGRMYAGAHMPLDVVGGGGLALMVAALTPLDPPVVP